MFMNVVIGKPLVEPKELLAFNEEDWTNVEKEQTFFTQNRWLPGILKEIGVVQSTSEIKRNKPWMMKELNELDCGWVTWGKRKVYFIVGE